MILSGNTIRKLDILRPFIEKTKIRGMSGGLSHCGYDLRVAEDLILRPGDFRLASTMEQFFMPSNVVGIMHDKSTWARRGIAVQNTVAEPGWRGYLTLEITNHGISQIEIFAGDPICQVLFHYVDEHVTGYEGKYQDQEAGPQQARLEV